MQKLNDEKHIISNILQADLWSEKYSKESSNDVVLPLYLYYDDLEVANTLGSHAGIHKLGAVYAFIACLSPHLACRLTNILFTFLFYS